MNQRSIVQRTLSLLSVLVLLGVLNVVALVQPAAALTNHYYLALGDSYPYGYQPNGDWSDGYADQFAAQMRQNDPNITLVNMACWGETTGTFIGGGCVGPANGVPTKVTYTDSLSSQLGTAKAFIAANGSAVKVVTIDVGLNDIVGNCLNPHTGRVNYTCVANELPIIYNHDLQIIQTLKSVASPSTQFMIANTFDAFQNILPNTIQGVEEYNQAVQQVASASGIPMVDIASSFHLNAYPNGGNPYLCPVGGAALTWACTMSDSHPTTAGYALMAQTFYSTLLATNCIY